MCCFAKRVGGGGGSIIEGGFGILPWLAVAGSTCWHWRPGRRSRLAGRGRQLDGGWSARTTTAGFVSGGVSVHSKLKSEPEIDLGGNPSPKSNPRIPETRMDTRNPRINTHIHMYKQEATNNKYFGGIAIVALKL